jgi:predicted glutamine amidotransferase
MCQLLGMNCNVPTDICFSFSGFQARGGATDVHSDGWGIAFFEGKGTRLFLDPQPSSTSPVAELVRRYPIRSKNVIAHIRKATQAPSGWKTPTRSCANCGGATGSSPTTATCSISCRNSTAVSSRSA